MKRKINQSRSRAARQVRNHAAVPITLTNFPGRVIWRGSVAELHAAPLRCGIPEPLTMAPTSNDPCVIAQCAIRASRQ
jgi:hypothetical protein